MSDYAMIIDGKRVAGARRQPVIDPALGEPFAECPVAEPEHLETALAAAERAFGTWRRDEGPRREALRRGAALLRENAQRIAELLTREQGKPLRSAQGEVHGAAAWFDYFASLDTSPHTVEDDGKRHIRIVQRPLGVVAAVTPWNYPVILLAWKFAPALLAGNTVVAKPSPFTPLTSLVVGEILQEVLPPGVVNVVTGGDDVGAALVAHPKVRKVSFTGSVATGKKIMRAAAEDLKRVTLELGGNDPAIVLDDVDPDQVAENLFWSAFENSGQVCTAVKRLYVHEKVYQPILERLVARARATRLGPGSDPQTELGPVNNEPQFRRVAQLVEDAVRRGAKIEAGGVPSQGKGYFFPPTIVTNVSSGVPLVDEEQFGPALPVIPYRDLEAAVEEANRTHYGLGASVWTSDPQRAEQLASLIEAGTVWINHHLDVTPYVPFGGVKWSGLGRENGRWGYDEFTELQVINERRS